MAKGVVVVPTYNEKENLEVLLAQIWQHAPDVDVLVVDDNSPDGTGRLADELKTRFPGRISVLHRARKEGLGRAYVHAFLTLLGSNYDFVVQMDADLSHDPKYLPALIGQLADYDVVLGSRYLSGVSVVNWDFKRLLLSKMASRYVRVITGLPVSDSTGGFKAWRMSALRSLDLSQVFSQGYLFQVEMTWRAFMQRLRVGETPIVFYERRLGQSKVDVRIISEAAIGVLKLRWKTRRSEARRFAGPVQAAK
jgi:dolichol-phosphate mannosyltransferase